MNKMKNILFTLCFTIITGAAFSQLLWSIEKKGLQHTSYLFGTLHQGDSSTISWDDNFLDAFYSCALFVGELDLTQTQEIDQTMNALMVSGMRDPNEKISPTLQDSINQITRQIATTFDATTADQLMMMKPILIQIQLMGLQRIKDGNMDFPNDPDKIDTGHWVMPDMVLTEKAQAADINVRGLETVEDQMNALFNIPMSVQWKSLYDELIQPDTTKRPSMNLEFLQKIYKQQDLAVINQWLNDAELPTSIAKELIVGRNYNMLNGIEEILQDQESVFFAVGAGHLGGKEGLIELLKQKNYQVKPVPFSWQE